MFESAFRRVVTGINAQGQSCVIIDGPVPLHGQSGNLVWRSASVPADNSGNDDSAIPYAMNLLHDGGSNFMIVSFPPGVGRFMHATDTLDYIVVQDGRITIELEAGEVTLGPGAFLINRGVKHAWRNDGPETAVMACITLPALPVGDGRTV